MVYCDAGFHLNINGKKRLEEYFLHLFSIQTPILYIYLPPHKVIKFSRGLS